MSTSPTLSTPSIRRGFRRELTHRWLGASWLRSIVATLRPVRNFYFEPLVLNDAQQRLLVQKQFITLARRTVFWFATLLAAAALVAWGVGEAARTPPMLFG